MHQKGTSILTMFIWHHVGHFFRHRTSIAARNAATLSCRDLASCKCFLAQRQETQRRTIFSTWDTPGRQISCVSKLLRACVALLVSGLWFPCQWATCGQVTGRMPELIVSTYAHLTRVDMEQIGVRVGGWRKSREVRERSHPSGLWYLLEHIDWK